MSNKEADPLKDEKEGKVQEVGSNAIWSLSSEKPGFGIHELRDNNFETYWQSDGQQPHFVNILFKHKTIICDVCIYTDYKQDESYTPNRISVRAGNDLLALQEVEVVDLNEPSRWIIIPLKDAKEQPMSTFLVQIAVLSNHQNGGDTRMRQIRIHSPKQSISAIPVPIESESTTSVNRGEDWNQNLVHASQCSDVDCHLRSCQRMKSIVQHAKSCKKSQRSCFLCKMFFSLAYYHAQRCRVQGCRTAFCFSIRHKVKRELLELMLHRALRQKARLQNLQRGG